MANKIITYETLQSLAGLIAKDLNNKSNVSHTHDILDIDGLSDTIGNINSFDVVIVESLPSTDVALTHTIYMVPKTTSETNNVYDEYMLLNGNFEKIGDTEIDLSQYATKTELSNGLSDKADKSHTHVLDEITDLDMTAYPKAVDVASALNKKADIDAVQTALDGKSDTSHTHNASEIGWSSTSVAAAETNVKGAIEAIALYSQELINGKAESSHTHTTSDITDLQTALDKKADIDALQTEFDKKANVTDVNNVLTSMQTSIDNKADSTHTHLVNDITDMEDMTTSDVETVWNSIEGANTGIPSHNHDSYIEKSEKVTSIVALTQNEYDALETKNSSTLYIII